VTDSLIPTRVVRMRGAAVVDTILTCGVEGTVVGFCPTWRANELNVDEAGRRWVGDNEGVTIDDLLVGLTATTVVVADVFGGQDVPLPGCPWDCDCDPRCRRNGGCRSCEVGGNGPAYSAGYELCGLRWWVGSSSLARPGSTVRSLSSEGEDEATALALSPTGLGIG